jgi:hypothetical protein
MLVHKIIPTTLTTKVGPDIVLIPTSQSYSFGPQYLTAFAASYPI